MKQNVQELQEEKTIHPEFLQEENHLRCTVEEIHEIIRQLDQNIQFSWSRQEKSRKWGDELLTFIHGWLRQDNHEIIARLETVLSNPYFGRVDFCEDGTERFIPFYIGRTKVMRPDLQSMEDILVYDWRDPVATLFYEGRGTRGSYTVKDRYTYTGMLGGKRRYHIENGLLLNMTEEAPDKGAIDLEGVIADRFLTDRLRQGSDNKLKDIVTTIQGEQNRIIREPLHQITVIQGVAGSGKSTIGLHRLSYLLYNEKLNPKRLVIIAPNKLFLDYICELLPEIDAADVCQTTYQDMMEQLTEQKWELVPGRPLFIAEVEKGAEEADRAKLAALKIKGRKDFAKAVDSLVEKKLQSFCQKLEEVSLMDSALTISIDEQIQRFFTDSHRSVRDRYQALAGYLRFRLRNFLDVEFADKNYRDNKEAGKIRQKEEALLEKYISRWAEPELLSVYRDLFKSKKYFKGLGISAEELDLMCRHTLEVLETGRIEREDLAPLAYLSGELKGWNMEGYDHIVVDEAQDMNEMEYSILEKISRNASFTIMGDLGQGIHAGSGIESWQQLLKGVFAEGRVSYHELRFSYRSAAEIVACFNRVMPEGCSKATPVYHIGHKPQARKVEDDDRAAQAVVSVLREFREKGCRTIGILTKKGEETGAVWEKIRNIAEKEAFAEPIHYIDGDTFQYRGGISVLPVHLAKGLEFDGVLLWDGSAEVYTEHPHDKKLMYVALSRAMHHLYILHRGTLSRLLR